MNKRGQGLSTNAIILIVLGVIVLVVLIIGFSLGWDKFMPWIKPDNNVKDIAQACQLACSGEIVYDYCTRERELGDADENEILAPCYLFSKVSDFKSRYGIAECPGLCDIKVCTDIKININKATATAAFKGPPGCDSALEYDITDLASKDVNGDLVDGAGVAQLAGTRCCLAGKDKLN